MNIAFTMPSARGDADRLLAAVAARLSARGLRLCGTVQTNAERPGGGRCDMDVTVLPDGPVIRISQSLGTGARGCRLDAEALDRAVALVEARLDLGADALVVNKFGRHEAEGRGFRDTIAAALARGIPVLVGLNPLNAAAFADFAAGLAVELPPEPDALCDWVLAAARQPEPAP